MIPKSTRKPGILIIISAVTRVSINDPKIETEYNMTILDVKLFK